MSRKSKFLLKVTVSIDEETHKYEIVDNKDEKKPENTLGVDKSKEEKKKNENKANNGEAGTVCVK